VSDALLIAVSIVLMIAVPFDVYVAWRFARAALVRPRTDVGNFVALVVTSVAIAATSGGTLGIYSIVFIATGDRLIPQPLPILLLAAALIVISLPNVYVIRRFRSWASEDRIARVHRRVGDQPRFHRRKDDPPAGPQ